MNCREDLTLWTGFCQGSAEQAPITELKAPPDPYDMRTITTAVSATAVQSQVQSQPARSALPRKLSAGTMFPTIDDGPNISLDELAPADRSDLQQYYDAFRRIQESTGVRSIEDVVAKSNNLDSALETLKDQEVMMFVSLLCRGMTDVR
jgi:hypothetical protein